jgi:hypothetical protein
MRPCREFKSAIREVSGLIRESHSRPLFWPDRSRSSREILNVAREGKEGFVLGESGGARARPTPPARKGRGGERGFTNSASDRSRGTDGSNPSPSSEESANFRFRCVGIDASARARPNGGSGSSAACASVDQPNLRRGFRSGSRTNRAAVPTCRLLPGLLRTRGPTRRSQPTRGIPSRRLRRHPYFKRVRRKEIRPAGLDQCASLICRKLRAEHHAKGPTIALPSSRLAVSATNMLPSLWPVRLDP